MAEIVAGRGRREDQWWMEADSCRGAHQWWFVGVRKIQELLLMGFWIKLCHRSNLRSSPISDTGYGTLARLLNVCISPVHLENENNDSIYFMRRLNEKKNLKCLIQIKCPIYISSHNYSFILIWHFWSRKPPVNAFPRAWMIDLFQKHLYTYPDNKVRKLQWISKKQK